jgi:hypothetical protein
MDPSGIGIQTRRLLVADTAELTVGNGVGNNRGDLQVAQALPERADLVRLGGSWIIRTAAVACVTAVPTTTAPATIWNGEPAGGKYYLIDNIGWICTTSAGAASMFALLAMVNILPQSSNPATADTLAIATLNGRKYQGRAGMSHAVTVVDDNWCAVGNAGNANALTATVGYAFWVPIESLIILPPGYLLSLACIAANATAQGKFCVQYHEVQIANQL